MRDDLGDGMIRAGDTALGLVRRQVLQRAGGRNVRQRFDQQFANGHGAEWYHAARPVSGRCHPPQGIIYAMRRVHALLTLFLLACAGCSSPPPAPPAPTFDVIIRGGTVYDGTGSPGRRADIGIKGDRIERVGDLSGESAKTTTDATGKAVAPGFINMLSWATESLLADGRSQGDIRQGVTLEIFGEGSSMGPLNDAMKKRMVEEMGDIKYDITWTTLAEYLKELERRGVSTNVASFIGATTIREHVIGLEDKKPTPAQLDEMRALVKQEMEAGALGIGSSLIYAPAFYASTEELIELCKVAAQYQGKYISHMRSEGNRLLEAVDELIRISREAKIPAEIYHLKAAGKANWAKIDAVIAMDREGPRRGAEDHRRHVHLPRRRDRPRRRDAAVGARRRLRGGVQAPQGPGDAQEDRARDHDAVAGLGEPLPRRRLRRTACCSSSSSPRR